MRNPIYKKIFKAIKDHDEIIIARHIGPDPDSIASQIALREAIRQTFPDKKVYAVGISVAKFKIYGLLDRIDDSLLTNPLLIVVDTPNSGRIDGVSIDRYKNIVKIDHHPYEEEFATIDYTDEKAVSTCEMLYRLINNTSLKMNELVARNLYMGIVSDSDRFLLSSTTAETFQIASELVRNYNLDVGTLYNYLFERPLNEVKFQAWITLNMTITENKFGYIKITNEIVKEFGYDGNSISNMVNNFNYIREIVAWAFVYYDEKIELHKVNMRSRGPIINEVATKYHGGGHKFASGCRIKNVEDVDFLLKDLDDICKKYNEELEITED